RRHQAQRQGRRPRQGASPLPLVREEALAGGDQAHAGQRPQVRARRPGQQGFSLPDQDVPAAQAEGGGLVGLARPPPYFPVRVACTFFSVSRFFCSPLTWSCISTIEVPSWAAEPSTPPAPAASFSRLPPSSFICASARRWLTLPQRKPAANIASNNPI